MYAFKRASKRQVFAPCVAELRILEAIEKGQYKEAAKKCNQALKSYCYIPKSHFSKIKFYVYKQEAAEYEGDVKIAKNYLDTLDLIADSTFGSNSIALAHFKLQKAIFEVKYGGKLNEAKSLFSMYYDKFLSTSLASNAPARLDYLENYAKLYELQDKPDSALLRAQEGYDVSSKALGKFSYETQYFLSLMALYQFNTGQYASFTASLNEAVGMKSSGISSDLTFYIKSLYLQSSLL